MSPAAVAQSGTIQIFVKTMSGERLSITARRSDSIEAIRQTAARQSGRDADSITLIFAGRQLDTQKTLADYNIGDGNTLYMTS